MERLRRRADFIAAAGGAKLAGRAFILQACARNDQGAPRMGFTVAKKVGTAVERNRIRRRLREVVRRSATGAFAPGHDYVLIGRRAALSAPFQELMAELSGALRRIQQGTTKRSRAKRLPAGADETTR